MIRYRLPRNLYAQRVELLTRPAPDAGGARIFDNRSLPLALVTGSGDAEKSLLEVDLTSTVAGWTGLRLCSDFSAGSMARFTRSVARNFNLFLRAKNRLFERERQVVAKILATRAGAPPVGAAAKKLAEDITEDVFKTRREIKSATERCRYRRTPHDRTGHTARAFDHPTRPGKPRKSP